MFYNTTALHVAKGAQDASDPIWTELIYLMGLSHDFRIQFISLLQYSSTVHPQ